MHVIGTFAELVTAEADVAAGRMPDRPFVLVVQPIDLRPVASPGGQAHALGVRAMCPTATPATPRTRSNGRSNGLRPGSRPSCSLDMSPTPRDFEAYNANYVGGDIAGGAHSGLQLVFRPTIAAHDRT